MASTIPTSTSVVESAVIPAPLAKVWHLIKLPTFTWWSAVESSSIDSNTSNETLISTWKFKDGTSLSVKQEEFSAIKHFITYSIIASEPALTYTSSTSTIQLYPITSGPQAGQTYIQWSANFSSDADAGVIEDARFKRQEALADLAKAVSSV